MVKALVLGLVTTLARGAELAILRRHSILHDCAVQLYKKQMNAQVHASDPQGSTLRLSKLTSKPGSFAAARCAHLALANLS